MISIIIPANNEASVITRCCTSIMKGSDSNELELIVVCNGCEDNTATIARSISSGIKIIETSTPSKSNALNIGDRHATGFPRFYVDADVVITIDAIRKTAYILQHQGVLAAAPTMQVDCTNRSWLVKAFYRIWLTLPYCREGMIGSGVYALSKEGRKRFKHFPNITADDGYARLFFRPQERLTLTNCTFTIFPPKNLRGLIKIKTRAFYGHIELKRKFPELFLNENSNHPAALGHLTNKPRWWGPLAVYCYVRITSKAIALYRYHFGKKVRWDRDETSR